MFKVLVGNWELFFEFEVCGFELYWGKFHVRTLCRSAVKVDAR
jgi:hypothetical protein